MSDVGPRLDEAARGGRFTALTVYRTPEGRWQASMRSTNDVTTWRVEIRDTPAEAVASRFFSPAKQPPKPVSSGVFD